MIESELPRAYSAALEFTQRACQHSTSLLFSTECRLFPASSLAQFAPPDSSGTERDASTAEQQSHALSANEELNQLETQLVDAKSKLQHAKQQNRIAAVAQQHNDNESSRVSSFDRAQADSIIASTRDELHALTRTLEQYAAYHQHRLAPLCRNVMHQSNSNSADSSSSLALGDALYECAIARRRLHQQVLQHAVNCHTMYVDHLSKPIS